MTRPRSLGRLAAGRRALIGIALGSSVALVGCGAGTPADSAAGSIATPRSTPSVAVQTTLAELDAALRSSGLVLESTPTTVRPAEPPSFASVARWPFHAVLPADPAGGYLVIYEFADPALAADGGRDLAAYITSGPGRVQYPPDVRYVLRQVGSTLVFYPWSPASSPDPMTPDLAATIASVGSGVPIPGG